MIAAAVVLAAAALAFANGANDNFKGVATLYGSRALGYRAALGLASATTLVGSLVSVALAAGLVRSFSGAGLVPGEVSGSPEFAASVACAGAVTILLATRLGMPTSTTHALTGALLGAALVVDGAESALQPFTSKFFAPLLFSPAIAIALTWAVLASSSRRSPRNGPRGATCVCITDYEPVRVGASATSLVASASPVVVAPVERCEEEFGQGLVLARSDRVAGAVHVLSAGSVCFARAVNDTPKIAALLSVTTLTSGGWTLGGVGLAMVAGGLLAARRVAETVSNRITPIDPVEGLSANLVTAGLVIVASRFGLPVSTTHVSCGSILGVGIATRSARWRSIAKIGATWITTLPFAALLGALLYSLLSSDP